jgi:hypothetical protein
MLVIEVGVKFRTVSVKWVMAKGDGREVGDRERSGSSCVFVSCSCYTREQVKNVQTFSQLNVDIKIFYMVFPPVSL